MMISRQGVLVLHPALTLHLANLNEDPRATSVNIHAMRTGWWVVVALLCACGNVSTTPIDAMPDGAPCVNVGAACTNNPGAPCLTGKLVCNNNELACVDDVPAADGTTCGAGLCNRGDCVPPVSVTSTVDLSTTPLTFGRSCAESPAYSVTALPTSTTATLSGAPDAGCLTAGDEVLLINLQGAPNAIANVGNYELLEIASATDTTVTFTTATSKFYGAASGSNAGIGVGATDQKVALVRLAELGELAVGAAGVVTTARWNGLTGGVVALRAASITVDGSISAAGLGYRNGQFSTTTQTCTASVTTETGESIDGPASATTSNRLGGPGGIGAGNVGFSTNTPINSGAGHATAGDMGSNGNGRTIGSPGATYGTADASTLTFGSGASGNLTCSGTETTTHLTPNTTPLAGGIIVIYAHQLTVSGTGAITASANQAPRSISASAGYVLIQGTTLSLGTNQVTAIGGAVPSSTVKSGNGYIVVKGTTVTGTTSPAATML